MRSAPSARAEFSSESLELHREGDAGRSTKKKPPNCHVRGLRLAVIRCRGGWPPRQPSHLVGQVEAIQTTASVELAEVIQERPAKARVVRRLAVHQVYDRRVHREVLRDLVTAEDVERVVVRRLQAIRSGLKGRILRREE